MAENYTTVIVGYIPEDYENDVLDAGDSSCDVECYYTLHEEGGLSELSYDEHVNTDNINIPSSEEQPNPLDRFKESSQFILDTFFTSMKNLNIGFSADDITIIEFLRMEELYELEEYVDDVDDLFIEAGESSINIEENEEYKGKVYVYISQDIDGEVENEQIYIYNKDFSKK